MATSGMIEPSGLCVRMPCVSAGLVMLQVGRFLPGWQQRPQHVKDCATLQCTLCLSCKASSERKNLPPLLT